MPQSEFVYNELVIPELPFSSPLTDLVIELDRFRRDQVQGTTHPVLFNQLKQVFHIIESIGSARIEGNNTTIAEFIETRLDKQSDISSGVREILNIEKAMAFIEDQKDTLVFNKDLIIRLYEMITEGLPSEIGVELRGQYRRNDVRITGVEHVPPDFQKVDEYMNGLLHFINQKDPPKYDLLRTAIAHHRFVWIHPFNDGNGRTVRMLTYAMLIKYGFGSVAGRIINPTAIFCNDRKAYYRGLAEADSGTTEGLLNWCLYVMKGLKKEMEKIDLLKDYTFIKKELLLPAISFSKERQIITGLEAEILKTAVEKQLIQAADIREYFAGKDNAIISRQIKKLLDKQMLVPEKDGARKYLICFNNSYLLRGIIKSLGDRGFLPLRD